MADERVADGQHGARVADLAGHLRGDALEVDDAGLEPGLRFRPRLPLRPRARAVAGGDDEVDGAIALDRFGPLADLLDEVITGERLVRYHQDAIHGREATYSSSRSAEMNASWGTSTRPMFFIRFLPSFCFSRSLRLRVMS